MQEAVSVFSASSKSNKEIESAGKKAVFIIFRGDIDHFLNLLYHKQLILQRNLLSNQQHYLQPTQLQGTIVFKHISR